MLIQYAAIITTVNIFIHKYESIVDNEIDLYALGLVIIIELVEIIVKLVYYCKNGGNDDDEGGAVGPEKDEDSPKKRNSFGSDEINPEHSRDELRGSQVQQGRRGAAPRRR